MAPVHTGVRTFDVGGAGAVGGPRDALADPLGPMPEDLTARPKLYGAAVDGTPESYDYVANLARVGAKEGFDVLVTGSPEHVAKLRADNPGLENLRTGPASPVETVFIEDVMHVRNDGTVSPTAPLGERGNLGTARDGADWAERPATLRAISAQLADRIRQAYPSAEVPKLDTKEAIQAALAQFPDAAFTFQGMIGHATAGMTAGSLAATTGAKTSDAKAYIEGGNVLVGTRENGERYAIVGRDTIAINAAAQLDEKGQPIGEEAARALVARDLGIDPKQLVVTPQPGTFHIDTAMATWEPGTVLLNDAREAARLQTEAMRAEHAAAEPTRPSPRADTKAWAAYRESYLAWHQRGAQVRAQIDHINRVSDSRARIEELAADSLRSAGLRVDRVPGRFIDPASAARPKAPPGDVMNFLNGEGGRNDRGQFYITAGGTPWAEKAFATAVGRVTHQPTRLHFATSPASARASLADGGSSNCRFKLLQVHAPQS